VEKGTIVFKLAIINCYHNSCFSLNGFLHHSFKFFKGDFSVSVLVYLFNDLFHHTGSNSVVAHSEHRPDLVTGDDAGSVLVEHLEGGLEEVGRVELLFVHGGNYEFCVVDEATVVGVNRLEHLLHLVVGDNFAVVVDVSLLDLVHGEATVTVLVEGLEDLGHLFPLTFRKHLRGDVGVSSLLHGGIGTETLEVLEGAEGNRLVNGCLALIENPSVLEACIGSRALVLVVGKHLGDEVLGRVGYTLPVVTSEADFTSAHSLHNVVIGLTREWRSTAQEDIADNSERPNIALGAIVLVKNFRSDVVRSS